MMSTAWPKLIIVLVVGYHCFTKAFAYIGIPPAHLFIGEIVLATIFLVRPEIALRWFLGSLVCPSPLAMVSLFAFCLMAYGGWELVRGLSTGYEVQQAMENAVFAIYPIYFFVGVWAGVERPGLFVRVLRLLAWTSAIYGTMWVLILAPPANAYDDGESSGLLGFAEPSASGLSVLAMICISRNFTRDLPVIGLNAVCLLALQMRAEWLATVVGLSIWSVMARRVGNAVGVLLGCVILLGTLQALNIELPGRTGQVTLTETTARLIAPFSPSLAQQMSPENAVGHIGSAEFRSEWWSKIWQNAHNDSERFLFGWGFGFPLRSLVFDADPRETLRSPHGVFFYALGYMGWLGVTLFSLLQAAIGWQCWTSSRLTGNPAAIVYWAAMITIGLMSNTFETPFGAIPFYLVCGLAMEPVVTPLWQATRERRQAHTPQIG